MVSHSGLLRNLIENDGLQKFTVVAGVWLAAAAATAAIRCCWLFQ